MAFPKSLLPIQTERLTLRRFSLADLANFHAYRQDPIVAQYQGWEMLSEGEAIAFINSASVSEIGVPGEWFQVAIALTATNVLLGDIGMHVSADNPSVLEIGFTLAKSAQKKGVAQEAVKAFIDHLFEQQLVATIIAITDERNKRSIKLIESLGFSFVRSDRVMFKGETCTELTYQLNQTHLK